MKLAGVQIGTEDPKKLSEFYTKVFGKPNFQQDDWYGYDVEGSGIMIGKHSEVHGQNDSPGRIMAMLTVKDVEKEFKRLEELGVKIIAKPYNPDPENSPDMLLATIADPDGNYIQIATPWE